MGNPTWPEVMREQVRVIRDVAAKYIAETDGMSLVIDARCDILLSYIDDLEHGRLPIEKPHRG